MGFVKDVYQAVTTPNVRFYLGEKSHVAVSRMGAWPFLYSDVFIKTRRTQGSNVPTETRIWAEAVPVNSSGSLYTINIRESEKPKNEVFETPGREQIYLKDGGSLLRPAELQKIIAALELEFLQDGYQRAPRQPYAACHVRRAKIKENAPTPVA